MQLQKPGDKIFIKSRVIHVPRYLNTEYLQWKISKVHYHKKLIALNFFAIQPSKQFTESEAQNSTS